MVVRINLIPPARAPKRGGRLWDIVDHWSFKHVAPLLTSNVSVGEERNSDSQSLNIHPRPSFGQFIHSVSKHLPRTYSVPGTGAKDQKQFLISLRRAGKRLQKNAATQVHTQSEKVKTILALASEGRLNSLGLDFIPAQLGLGDLRAGAPELLRKS